jgi:hypothetical protein
MELVTLARRAATMIPIAVAIASCESQDPRLAEIVQRASEQQARQNERMAQQSEAVVKQSQEVAAAAHDLVEQDATARRELIEAHNRLQVQHQAERVDLDQQREEIHIERRASALAAVRDPVIARAVIAGGLFLAALLPLLVTLYALKQLPQQAAADELLTNVLFAPLTADQRSDMLADLSQQALPETLEPRLSESDDSSDP